jgi:hypothetical protein
MRTPFAKSTVDPVDELAELAGTLLRRAREAALPEIDQGTRVLMDIELDGLRCLLMRTAPSPDRCSARASRRLRA